MIAMRTGALIAAAVVGGCCGSFDGFGRYTLGIDCDTVQIDGDSYQITRSGEHLLLGTRVLQRGINRDAAPWLYLHEANADQVDITFDKGSKEIYPLYTGATASIFDVFAHPWPVARSTNAAFADGFWLVFHRWVGEGLLVDLHRRTGDVTEWTLVQADILVANDGSVTAIPEIGAGVEVTAFDAGQQTATVRFTPLAAERIPVVFVHGHSRTAQEVWRSDGSGSGSTSFAAALEANPGLPIDAFYLELPVHGNQYPENFERSIEEDAADILAMIEGGEDSQGVQQTGILNMSEYQDVDRVALVAYSQGTLSSRYYLKHLMGSLSGGAIRVSEFVALAAPNHGVGGLISCGDPAQPDRARRQLCGGISATISSVLGSCGNCPGGVPEPFSTNGGTDATFITELNGHAFDASCQEPSVPQEAPRSRPTTPDGVLYLNLFAAGNADLFVGGDQQGDDCVGRRLARNHAPDAVNREVDGIGGAVHSEFPHSWPVICLALKTVTDHAVPANQAVACEGLVQPSGP